MTKKLVTAIALLKSYRASADGILLPVFSCTLAFTNFYCNARTLFSLKNRPLEPCGARIRCEAKRALSIVLNEALGGLGFEPGSRALEPSNQIREKCATIISFVRPFKLIRNTSESVDAEILTSTGAVANPIKHLLLVKFTLGILLVLK